MALTIPLELSVGQPIRLVMLLPHCEREIRIEATVRNRKGHRYGVEFTSLCGVDRELLEQRASAAEAEAPSRVV